MWCCFLAIALLAQPAPDGVKKLSATILRLKTSDQLTADILAMAEPRHPPRRALVVLFSESLAGALAGKDLDEKPVARLSASILEVLQSAGTGTHKFQASVDRAQEALKTLGVSDSRAQAVAARLASVGKSVRGPEDLPVQPLR